MTPQFSEHDDQTPPHSDSSALARIRLALLIASLSACASADPEPPPAVAIPRQHREPAERQISIAHPVADRFAISQLSIGRSTLHHYVVTTHLLARNGRRIMLLSYFDSRHFPDPRQWHTMLGGFPMHFTISVDLEDGQVVDHYASPQ